MDFNKTVLTDGINDRGETHLVCRVFAEATPISI